ncbi:hypothetical protein EMIT0P4_40179 [Pseudomonas sp. IT-P4]
MCFQAGSVWVWAILQLGSQFPNSQHCLRGCRQSGVILRAIQDAGNGRDRNAELLRECSQCDRFSWCAHTFLLTNTIISANRVRKPEIVKRLSVRASQQILNTSDEFRRFFQKKSSFRLHSAPTNGQSYHIDFPKFESIVCLPKRLGSDPSLNPNVWVKTIRRGFSDERKYERESESGSSGCGAVRSSGRHGKP